MRAPPLLARTAENQPVARAASYPFSMLRSTFCSRVPSHPCPGHLFPTRRVDHMEILASVCEHDLSLPVSLGDKIKIGGADIIGGKSFEDVLAIPGMVRLGILD